MSCVFGIDEKVPFTFDSEEEQFENLVHGIESMPLWSKLLFSLLLAERFRTHAKYTECPKQGLLEECLLACWELLNGNADFLLFLQDEENEMADELFYALGSYHYSKRFAAIFEGFLSVLNYARNCWLMTEPLSLTDLEQVDRNLKPKELMKSILISLCGSALDKNTELSAIDHLLSWFQKASNRTQWRYGISLRRWKRSFIEQRLVQVCILPDGLLEDWREVFARKFHLTPRELDKARLKHSKEEQFLMLFEDAFEEYFPIRIEKESELFLLELTKKNDEEDARFVEIHSGKLHLHLQVVSFQKDDGVIWMSEIIEQEVTLSIPLRKDPSTLRFRRFFQGFVLTLKDIQFERGNIFPHEILPTLDVYELSRSHTVEDFQKAFGRKSRLGKFLQK